MHGKCPHQIFEKDRFQNYALDYSKNAIFAGENQQNEENALNW